MVGGGGGSCCNAPINGLAQEVMGGGGRGRAIHGKFDIFRFSNGRSGNGLMHKGWCLQLWSSMIF